MKKHFLKFIKYSVITVLSVFATYEFILIAVHLTGMNEPSSSTEYKIRVLRLKQLSDKIKHTHITDLHKLYEKGWVTQNQLIFPMKSGSDIIGNNSSSDFENFCAYYVTVSKNGKWCLHEKKSDTGNYVLSINSDGIIKNSGTNIQKIPNGQPSK